VSYKTIIVHLDCGERRTERLGLSVTIAEQFDAHLIGVFALDIMRIPSYAMAEEGPLIVGIERKRRAEAAQQAEREFRGKVASRVGKSEWRMLTGEPVAAVAFAARCADLVVIGQLDPNNYETDCVPRYFTEDVVLAAGKPVLVVPYAGHFAQVGKRSMVAWKPTREASRAVWDTLPMLQRCEAVEVALFEHGKDDLEGDEIGRRDMTRYLERHAVNAKIAGVAVDQIEVGEAVLSRAADFGADSIVMGAYGHSRLRERVLGGATRTVLESMTVPVFMSH
jgi:nucleotide-binding universal stress UspA family protein